MMGYDDPEKVTPLYMDMYIAAELLHCSHEEFLRLPRMEKQKLRLYVATKAKKLKEEREDLELRMKSEELKAKAPKVEPVVRNKK